jgi:putative phosphoribosyl transferase
MTTISYSRPIDRPVRIQIDGGSIEADWTMPMDAQGVVIFAHGSGSSRFSRRNRIVTRELYDRKFGSLLVDLLTTDEEHEDMLTAALRFDVNLLSERLIAAATWVKGEVDSAFLPVGFFATGVGAAAALHAAAYRPNLVDAIVSRGGRPDLAGVALHKVKAPTLLIVGGDDVQALALNRWAYWRLDCERKLEVIKGATHRFEERGAMETATALAMEWFDVHLPSHPTRFSLPRTTSTSSLHV